MSLIIIDWKPTPKALRQFGWIMLLGMGLFGGLTFWKGHHTVAYIMWSAGVVFGATGLSGKRIALPFYYAWMGIAFVAGTILSQAVLIVFFYGVFGIMGVIMKLLRRDRLALRNPEGKTMWCDCPIVSDVEHYQRQS